MQQTVVAIDKATIRAHPLTMCCEIVPGAAERAEVQAFAEGSPAGSAKYQKTSNAQAGWSAHPVFM
jgi:hypothetical protein